MQLLSSSSMLVDEAKGAILCKGPIGKKGTLGCVCSHTFKRKIFFWLLRNGGHGVHTCSTESVQDNAGKPQLSGYIIDKKHVVVINNTGELITLHILFLFLFHHPNEKSLVNEGYFQAAALVLNALGVVMFLKEVYI
ncbi:hypothetical protein H5410_053415 [Solanum commersonii]|uniref:Uncharacterized protein n=1 Tax=Solanum commersonii TaxID=4109 RepID=A0A9J5X681_SOLCO|nr:hypothetical protein H5410_053415 [Solanum commersonii]